MRHLERPKIRTQFIIFNLFGDYVNPRSAAVWTSGIVEILGMLGVSERATRSTLSRMKAKGWLTAQKHGRRSMYRLTDRGKALLEEGSRRIFDTTPTHWDQSWHIVVYSLPQQMRAKRHELRTRLSWLGYGMLEPGTMVAAIPRSEEVQSLLLELKVEPYVTFFTRAKLEDGANRDIVARCWDLANMNQRYSLFVKRFQTEYEALLKRNQSKEDLPPDECFVHRFWLTYEFSSFPRQDPNLPEELLPSNWRGNEAAELLRAYRALMRDPAQAFVNDALGLETTDTPLLQDMVAIPGM
jgi:phenylacetic acid degradation operon negative regulatory protein